jgi:hypothetical protein
MAPAAIDTQQMFDPYQRRPGGITESRSAGIGPHLRRNTQTALPIVRSAQEICSKERFSGLSSCSCCSAHCSNKGGYSSRFFYISGEVFKPVQGSHFDLDMLTMFFHDRQIEQNCIECVAAWMLDTRFENRRDTTS